MWGVRRGGRGIGEIILAGGGNRIRLILAGRWVTIAVDCIDVNSSGMTPEHCACMTPRDCQKRSVERIPTNHALCRQNVAWAGFSENDPTELYVYQY